MRNQSSGRVSFADVVHQTVSFSRDIESQALILDLIDTEWFQRLRDISQTANTRLVYMFSEHSRFGHCIGAAYLAELLLDKLAHSFPNEIKKYRNAVAAAAVLHDIGHLAPGSHTAYKTWFPKSKDIHEELAVRIVREDKALRAVLERYGKNLPDTVANVLCESDKLPPWTWEIISGGGWNVDRGNWCIVDSILAGVNYGEYNIPALTESIVLSSDGHLGLLENRLDAMMHFAVSRHAMYRQLYQHRVLLAADMLNRAVAQRARDLGDQIPFADDAMHEVLRASGPGELSLATVFAMRESWWRYHLMRWSSGEDTVLADLSSRLINRRLLKTVRVIDQSGKKALWADAERAVEKAGFDPRYYLHEVSTVDMHAGDYRQSMQVILDDGSTKQLGDADPLLQTLLRESRQSKKVWLAMPAEAKAKLGRSR